MLNDDFDVLKQKVEVTAQQINLDIHNLAYVAHNRKRKVTIASFAKEAKEIDKQYENLSVDEMRDLVLSYKIRNPNYATDQDINVLPPNEIFDLNNIQDILSKHYVPKHGHAKGITTPMIYLGQAGSVFGEHVEDLNLASISILLKGKPKEWYFIPASQLEDLEKLHNDYKDWPSHASVCDMSLRHKAAFFHPEFLKKSKITVHRVSILYIIDIF